MDERDEDHDDRLDAADGSQQLAEMPEFLQPDEVLRNDSTHKSEGRSGSNLLLFATSRSLEEE